MKKITKKEKQPMAKLIFNGADYSGHLVIIAKWLRHLANDFLKNARKQNKTNKPIYSKRFIARHY